MKLALLLASAAFSVNAYVLPSPTVAPLRTTGLIMNDAPKPPKKDFMLTLNGGRRTVEDVYADQKKAAKKEDLYASQEPVLGGYSAGGWTTNKVK